MKNLGKKNINMESKFKVSFEVEIKFDENEITEQEAIQEITFSMYFPCEDTDNVTIVQQTVVENQKEAKKPFVWLTITGEHNAQKFTEITGIGPDHGNGEDFDFHDIDLSEDPAQVMRALAEVGRGAFISPTKMSQNEGNNQIHLPQAWGKMDVHNHHLPG